MMRILKWVGLAVVIIAIGGFLTFLYMIPPFFSTSSEQYVKDTAAPAVSLDGIKDPVQRAIAERGKYIVTVSGCGDCHNTPGPQGPDPNMYLAGGGKLGFKGAGIAVSRNLTSDPETGLGKIKDDDIKRVLRSGVFHDGRMMHHRQMPWNAFANWTEEDRHAVVTYLRLVKAITHKIPDPDRTVIFDDKDALGNFFGTDGGTVPAK
ncbi:MAG TPA: hypothetical protein VF456_22120 [Vicinamibacterales bacterium]